jgi:hypothetical protein
MKIGRVVLGALFAVVLLGMTLVRAQGSHGLNLTWTASTSVGVAGQNVYRGTISGGPYTKLTATPLTPTTLAYLDPVVDGKTYFYVVTAISQGPIVLESGFSNQASATAPGPLPNPQTGLGATAQ